MSDSVETWRPADPPRPLGSLLRIVLATIGEGLRCVARRLASGPLHDGWSFSLELFVSVQRGAWGLIASEGVVNWRHAIEGLVTPKTPGARRSASAEGGIAGDEFLPTEGVPAEAEGCLILYLHGGAYIFGSSDTHAPILGELARRTRLRVFAPDYRLAPEYPQPAAEEDALAAYRGLIERGVSPQQIVIAGDSAGGNLALVTLLRLRAAGDPLPAAAVLICPWTDLSCSGKSFESNAAFDYISLEAARLAASEYLGDTDPKDPAVSPLYADLAGLPPLLIQAGGAETLRDQIVKFGERASAAGVDTQLSVYENMIHDWQMFSFIPQAGHALAEIAVFVDERTRVE